MGDGDEAGKNHRHGEGDRKHVDDDRGDRSMLQTGTGHDDRRKESERQGTPSFPATGKLPVLAKRADTLNDARRREWRVIGLGGLTHSI